MYQKDETRELVDATQELLKKHDQSSFLKKKIALLRSVLKFHEYRYYILSDPLISDREYDVLYQALVNLETADPSMIIPDSPTQRVAKGLTRINLMIKH